MKICKRESHQLHWLPKRYPGPLHPAFTFSSNYVPWPAHWGQTCTNAHSNSMKQREARSGFCHMLHNTLRIYYRASASKCKQKQDRDKMSQEVAFTSFAILKHWWWVWTTAGFFRSDIVRYIILNRTFSFFTGWAASAFYSEREGKIIAGFPRREGFTFTMC